MSLILSMLEWKHWLLILLILFFVLWLFYGGKSHPFVGLDPLNKKLCQDETSSDDTTSVDLKKVIKDIRDETSFDSIDHTPKLPDNLAVKSVHKTSKKEELCRHILEEIYNKPFISVRPKWLKYPETGHNLELDCYNDELKIALEYNGEQHYIYPHYFHANKEQFISQVKRDIWKIDTCDTQGVYLITVPYNVPVEKLKSYIEYYLPENAAKRIQDQDKDLIDFSERVVDA